jgi:poly(A) polymerase
VVFAEDPLRMLRAARFIATLGMLPDETIRAVARERAADLLRVSPERWLLEMNRLLIGPVVDLGLGFLVDTGLMGHLLPEVQAVVEFAAGQGRRHHKAVWPHTVSVVGESPARVAVRWAALLHDAGKVTTRSVDASGEVHFLGHEAVGAALVEAVARRFRFDNDLRERVRSLVLLHQRPALYDGTWSDAAVRRFIRDAGPYLEDLLALSRADITSHRPGVREAALARNAELAGRVADLVAKDGEGPLLPKGLGRDLMARFGLEEGPAVGALKRRLEQAVLDGLLPRNGDPAVYLEHLEKEKLTRAPA